MISKEALVAKRDDIIKQRDNAFAVQQQAIGALALLDHLIQLADEGEDDLTLEKLAEALGAESAEISPIESDGG